ncbi:hypothetical protein BJY04DRAFT_230198 [Aspergillus karnatakaensis]|uniref:uncharacterized protein n=1 Tax=Aspergillus karnatakaensis TaxID=1810916 RepID=UPI003CCE305F
MIRFPDSAPHRREMSCELGKNCSQQGRRSGYSNANQNKLHEVYNAADPDNSSSTGGDGHRRGKSRASPRLKLPYRGPTFAETQESPSELKDFLTTTISAVTSSEQSRQALIRSLATESGLARVRRIVETKFTVQYSVTTPMFDPHCLLFLRLITDKRLLKSLALEQAIGTIYNVIYGLHGARAVSFFQMAMDCLDGILHDSTLKNQEDDAISRLSQLVLVAKALLQTVTVNQGAALQTGFRDIATRLNQHYMSEKSTAANDEVDHFSQGYEDLRKVIDFLDMGDELAILTAMEQAPSVPHIDKSEPVDFLGDLSHFDPRHDNDHALIENIRILPTVSEIQSLRDDFLPTKDAHQSVNSHHQKGISRLLDSQFRLLREDTAGLLRDAVRMVVNHWETITSDDWGAKRKLIRNESPTPMRIYYGAQIRLFRASGMRGLEVEIEFDQIKRAKRMSISQRRKHWINCRALREGGGLVALVDAPVEDDIKVVFLQISKRETNPIEGSTDVKDVVSSRGWAMVTLRCPSTPTKRDLSGLIDMKNDNQKGLDKPLLLVEFPAVQYNQFEGILRCLQSLNKKPMLLPFRQWLTCGGKGSLDIGINLCVPPPFYLKNATLDLSAITKTNFAHIGLSLWMDLQAVSGRLEHFSSLDPGQARALVSALTHEISLTQGPPGTGKSYVGIQIARCLLSNKDQLTLGPILCVCYTNHALDQFLTELKKTGVSRIVRNGSRSQSEDLESLSLDAYKKRQKIPRIIGQGRCIGASKDRLESLAAQIEPICQINTRLSGYSAQITEGHSEPLKKLEAWISGNGPGDMSGDGTERSIDQLFAVPAWSLTNKERFLVYQYCYSCGTNHQLQELEDLLQAQAGEKQQHTAYFTQADAQIFDQVDVVGVTTTGLANNIDLLRRMQAKVLICEEAGEVLESHFLTALLPSVEHAILIGDHLQLRPRISRLELSLDPGGGSPKYNLDESLFERLANMKISLESGGHSTDQERVFKFPITQLDLQRRMHPSISSLIRRDLYPNLQDHSITHEYPKIAGVKQRLFWLDHENIEDPSDPEDPMQSKTNRAEAEMVTALVSHLCRQGKYKPGDIAVLTPYISQLRLLKEMRENIVDLVISEPDQVDLNDFDDEGGQTATRNNNRFVHKVDSFQGEEAVVVIISLVQSNRFRNCGFLKTPNRINVLLSRARHVPMWGSVIQMLEDSRSIGPQLELQCPRHLDAYICVSTPEDFSKYAPEGGCSSQCGLRLECGHSCTFKCHSTRLHNNVKCIEVCTRPRKCGHACRKRCSEHCGDCLEVIPDVFLPCGHKAHVRCQDMGDIASLDCKKIITKKLPRCGHSVQARCSRDITTIRCCIPCGSPRACGHACENECWSCHSSDVVDHGSCKTLCGRSFTTCEHTCMQPCHAGSPCHPCRLPCEVRCEHSRCPRKCSEPCPLCAESCGWRCSHSEDSCELPCAVPCNILPCNNPCNKALSCGHTCPGTCGETCPDAKLCHECGGSQALQRCVEFLEMQTYKDVDTSQDPIIFLSCGHFYTRSTMDSIMELERHYEIDPSTGTLLRPRPGNSGVANSRPSACPECRRPLRNIHRYNRIVKTALLHESTKRFTTKANQDYTNLYQAVVSRIEELEDERSKFVSQWGLQNGGDALGVGETRQAVEAYNTKDTQIRRRIKQFINSVGKIEQPFCRVNALIASTAARARMDCDDNAELTTLAPLDEAAVLTGFELRGNCLFLQLNWAILSDYDKIRQNTTVPATVRALFRDRLTNDLPDLLDRCRILVEASVKDRFIAEQVQGIIYEALFSRLLYNNTHTSPELPPTQILEKLAKCERLFSQYPGTLERYATLLTDAKRFCNGGIFYSSLTAEEKQQIYQAMDAEFLETGHWYYCHSGIR